MINDVFENEVIVEVVGEVCGVCGCVYVNSIWNGMDEVCGSCEDWYVGMLYKGYVEVMEERYLNMGMEVN